MPQSDIPPSSWPLLDHDREIFAREIDDFLPTRIFDAHAHLYVTDHNPSPPSPLLAQGPGTVGLPVYTGHMSALAPGREFSGLFFGFPHADLDLDAENQFVASEVRGDPGSRAHMLVKPGMDPDFVRQTVQREGFVGLKCYHAWSSEQPTFDARIESFLPEEFVRLADEEGLSITLHMVRRRAMADPLNQQVIRAWAEKYPNMRWILAHAARGFNPHHTIEGIASLRGLRNVWCDTSAVTDAGAFEAIIETLGYDRLLFGSDFPVSHDRGRCVAIGDSFLWLSETNTKFEASYAPIQPTLVGIESLRILKNACRYLKLGDSQVEAIFYGNAANLYSLPG